MKDKIQLSSSDTTALRILRAVAEGDYVIKSFRKNLGGYTSSASCEISPDSKKKKSLVKKYGKCVFFNLMLKTVGLKVTVYSVYSVKTEKGFSWAMSRDKDSQVNLWKALGRAGRKSILARTKGLPPFYISVRTFYQVCVNGQMPGYMANTALDPAKWPDCKPRWNYEIRSKEDLEVILKEVTEYFQSTE